MSSSRDYEHRPLPQCGKSITKTNTDGSTYYATRIKLRDHVGKCF